MKKTITIIILFALIISIFPIVNASSEGEIVNPYRQYSYEQMCADISALEARYPELISVSVLGQSVEGRDIPVFRLGKGDREIIICATMHAREYFCTNFVMYMTEQYCVSYNKNEWYAGLSYQEILDNVCFVIVPMLNPDGVNLAQNGIENAQQKDKLEQMELVDTGKNGYYAWKANINGVDLNRNWPYYWAEDAEVKSPASANYNGSAPLTEPEVIAMKKLIDETPFYMLCSFHISGQVIYWIDSSNSQEMYNAFSPIISRFARWTGYTKMYREDVSEFGGYMVNYARAMYQKPCFTVELLPMQYIYPHTNASYRNFKYTVERVLPLGLLMADEVMKMPQQGDVNIPTNNFPSIIPNGIKVFVDDEEVIFPDMRPIIENGRTLVPLRAVCEKMGLYVGYKSGEIIVKNSDTEVVLHIGENEIFINGESKIIDVPPKIYEDRTLLPIRAVLEAFGHSLDWDGINKIVYVKSNLENNDIVITE